MKVYINRTPRESAWGGGNMATKALYKHAWNNNVETVTVGGAFPDAILLMGHGPEDGNLGALDAVTVAKNTQNKVKVVLRVNETDAHRCSSGIDDLMLHLSTQVDGTIFVSNWVKDYFLSRGWVCPRNTVIINGVETSSNFPTKNNDGKVKIVSHHWSDNPRKSSEITQWIDDFVGKHSDEFEFTFVGRTKLVLPNSVIVPPLHGDALWYELKKHDVYVSESRFDTGPNHIAESISVGLPTYVHVEGGGCVEFAGKDHVYSDIAQLERILRLGRFELNTALKLRNWETFSSDVWNFVNEVVKG